MRLEHRLLVVLHVLGISERQALHRHHQRDQRAGDPPAMAAHQLGRVGIALLRHDRRAGREAVGQRDEAERLARPEDELLGQPRQMQRALGRRPSDSRARSRGRRRCRASWRSAGRSRARSAVASRSIGKQVPASAAAPSGHSFSRARARRRSASGRAGASRNRPSDGGRASPAAPTCKWVKPGMIVVGMLVGAGDQRALQRRRAPQSTSSIASRTHSRKSVATWSLRERAVCSRPAAGPISSASRCSTCMWMSSSAASSGTPSASYSSAIRSSPSSIASASSWRDDALRAEHRDMGLRRRDILRATAACRRRSRHLSRASAPTAPRRSARPTSRWSPDPCGCDRLSPRPRVRPRAGRLR